jgi:nucleoside-triphosphatase THEP1
MIVFITGAQGIGKSQLAKRLADEIQATVHEIEDGSIEALAQLCVELGKEQVLKLHSILVFQESLSEAMSDVQKLLDKLGVLTVVINLSRKTIS